MSISPHAVINHFFIAKHHNKPPGPVRNRREDAIQTDQNDKSVFYVYNGATERTTGHSTWKPPDLHLQVTQRSVLVQCIYLMYVPALRTLNKFSALLVA